MKAIAEMVADLLRRPEKSSPKIPVSRNLGFPRVRCYELLMVDQELANAAISVGTTRLWPIVFLDYWLAKQQGKKIEPRP